MRMAVDRQEAEKLVEQLKEAVDKSMNIATAIRTEMPLKSFYFFKQAELMSKAAEELKRNIPQEIKIEGGLTWWYVCPECHGAIDRDDHYCKHCGQAVEE